MTAGTPWFADGGRGTALPMASTDPLVPVRPEVAAELLSALLRRTHLSAPDDLARIVDELGRGIGARRVDLYLIDYELETLRPLPTTATDIRPPLLVEGTTAGAAFSQTTIIASVDPGDGARWIWLPLLDGTERLGVMAVSYGDGDGDVPEATLALLERYAHLVAALIVTKGAYGDVFELTRRRRPKSIASELVWELTPPLLFATDDVVITGMLEPCYDNGGDALDFSFDRDTLHLAIFDAMGHGLPAAGQAAFALSAYRHGRRRGLDLAETYASMDAALGHQFPGESFVTALVARLDVPSGELTWFSAGHPPPLVLRGGEHARVLPARPATPLGVLPGTRAPTIGRATLQPGDMLLLYTDGLTEARVSEASRLGVDGLSAFIEREVAATRTSPEALRRLRHAIVATHRGELDDDATALLVEWRRGGERALLPATV
jgi:hypothetical protein